MQMKKGLTNNQLKIIAMLTMLCDHVGRGLLPEVAVLTIIGRLSYPIFAYMIAEGCRYTKNRIRYFFTIFILAFACQVVYYFAMDSMYQSILVTFSLSILTIYAMDNFLKKKSPISGLIALLELAAVVAVCLLLPGRVQGDFEVDYGLIGVLVPVVVYFAPGKVGKIIFSVIMLSLLALATDTEQWFGLLAVPLLMLYNGERGKCKLKYMFYIFYPTHLVAIYLIGLAMGV